jgi:hypothetical protein
MDRKAPAWWTMFEDNSGGFSNLRVLLTVVTATILINWTGAYWTSFVMEKPLPGFPTEAIALISTLAGIKMVQRFGEKPAEEPPTQFIQGNGTWTVTPHSVVLPANTVVAPQPPQQDGGNVTTMP